MATSPTLAERLGKSTLVFLGSSIVAVVATVSLGNLAESQGWCCFHGWALAHDTGAGVLLIFGLMGYHLVRIIGVRTGVLTANVQFGWLAHFTYIAAIVATFPIWRLMEMVPLTASIGRVVDETLPDVPLAAIFGLISGQIVLVRYSRGRQETSLGLSLVGIAVCLLVFAFALYASAILGS